MCVFLYCHFCCSPTQPLEDMSRRNCWKLIIIKHCVKNVINYKQFSHGTKHHLRHLENILISVSFRT